jgi:hypothetical protein
MKAELEECRGRIAKELGTPSVIENCEPAGTTARRVAPPGGGEGKLYHEPTGTTARRVAPYGGEGKLYSEALGCGNSLKPFQLTVKCKGSHPLRQ